MIFYKINSNFDLELSSDAVTIITFELSYTQYKILCNLPTVYKKAKEILDNQFGSEEVNDLYERFTKGMEEWQDMLLNDTNRYYNYYNADDLIYNPSATNWNVNDTITSTLANASYDGSTITCNDLTVNDKKLNKLIDTVEELKTKIGKDKTSMNTNTLFGNFDFGPVDENRVHLSFYGIAIKNKDGNWVAFDRDTGDIMNVEILNFSAKNFIYKMPVALSAIEVGDIIIHNHVPVFVEGIENNEITVVDIYNGEKKIVLPTKSPFGFNFYTKVVSLAGTGSPFGEANAENPFGSMLPVLALAGGDNIDIGTMLAFSMMNGNGSTDMNSMLPFLLMKDGSTDNLLPLMFFMNSNK